MTQRLLTPTEASAPDQLHMSVDSVLMLVATKQLRAIKIGKRILIPAKAIEQFCDRAFDDEAAKIPSRPLKPSERRRAIQNGSTNGAT